MTWVLRVLLLALACLLLPSGALAQAGDAFGDGSLLPPTAPRFADPAWYDITDVAILDTDPISLRFSLAAVDVGPERGLPSQPIVELYVATASGGAEALLPGSGLSMPLDTGWRWAVRVTPDGVWGWEADADGRVDLAAAVVLDARLSEREITVTTPFARPEEAPPGALEVYAVSGVYDPFSADGWRALTRQPSPWSFSSESQRFPVVDVFPGDATARADALARGELPRAARALGGYGPGAALWLALMALGVALAALGVVVRARASALRRRTVRARPAQTPEPGTSEATAAGTDPSSPSPSDEARVAPAGDASAQSDEPPLIDDDEVVSWPPAPAPHRALPAPSDAAAQDAASLDAQSAAGAAAATPASEEGVSERSETSAPSDAKRDAKPS